MCAVAINQCTSAERPAPCDKNADCVATGPAQFLCSCRRGYEGDGFVCSPVDPCQLDDGRCPVASTRCVYLGPGQVGAAAAGRGRGEGGRPPRVALCRGRHLRGENSEYWRLHCNVLV